MSIATVAVVIPAYQESALIAQTLRSIPKWVDLVVVVDDGSSDDTAQRARDERDPRVTVIAHTENRGVGAAIRSGYEAALRADATFVAVMAGDNQMDPEDLPGLLEPLLSGAADYVKGDRLMHERARDMPLLRRWGTRFLARVTSWGSGLQIRDSQCGYTVIAASALEQVDLATLWQGYGYPNDLIIGLAARGLRIAERPVRPVYEDEKSGLRPWHLLVILFVIARRIWLERSTQAPMDRAIQGELSS